MIVIVDGRIVNERVPAPYSQQQKREFFEGMLREQREFFEAMLRDMLTRSMCVDDITCDRHKVDEPPKKIEIERAREWAHSPTAGKGENCDNAGKPIYTAPNDYPGECERYNCDSGEWMGRGLVTREKGTDNIISRDREKK